MSQATTQSPLGYSLSELDTAVEDALKLQNGKANIIITIDGIVAAGKTTLAKELCTRYEHLKPAFFEESFDRELLVDYIANPSVHAVKFMEDITRRKIAIYEEAKKHQLSIIDRSYHGDLAFSCLRCCEGHLTLEFVQQQKAQFDSIDLSNSSLIKVFIGVDTVTALERCRRRDREGEQLYTLEYFERLSFYHIGCITNSDIIVRAR